MIAPEEQPRGLAGLVSRFLGRVADERVSSPASTRDANAARDVREAGAGSRKPMRDAGAVRDAAKVQAGARAGATAQGKATDNGRGVDPANSDQAKTLRAMMAARNSAPGQTPESMREALAAAKKTTGFARDQDYGAER